MGRGGKLVEIEIDFGKIARIQKALQRMPEVIIEEIGTAVRDLVLMIEAEAKRLCPVDTGNLRSSITPEVLSWAEGYVGTNVNYAPWVEYGTVRTPAQPFMEPAFLFGKKASKKIFGQAISRAIARFERSAR